MGPRHAVGPWASGWYGKVQICKALSITEGAFERLLRDNRSAFADIPQDVDTGRWSPDAVEVFRELLGMSSDPIGEEREQLLEERNGSEEAGGSGGSA